MVNSIQYDLPLHWKTFILSINRYKGQIWTSSARISTEFWSDMSWYSIIGHNANLRQTDFLLQLLVFLVDT